MCTNHEMDGSIHMGGIRCNWRVLRNIGALLLSGSGALGASQLLFLLILLVFLIAVLCEYW